ncbi:hypothetical protein M569_11620, partial [Genlisea aurea]
MASRTVFRKKRALFDSVKPSGYLEGISFLKNEKLSESSDSHCRKTDGIRSLGFQDVASSLEQNGTWPALVTRHFGHSLLGVHVVRNGARIYGTCFSAAAHYLSTAAVGQPRLNGSEKKNEESVVKQKSEPSPEECDLAVEDLGSAKAKAKGMKKLQESEGGVALILQKVWSMLLGIGPNVKAVASMSRDDWGRKLNHWKDEFMNTLKHYWLGMKLLWAHTRISLRLLLKLAGGKTLTRREGQQLRRTATDIFRLGPFAVFVIVPFMEILLPVFLKVFPDMLPSTFQDKMKEQEALKKRLNARIKYAEFLQETVKEMANEVQKSRSAETKKTAEDLYEFMNKVRRGSRVSNDEILGFAKLFNDELTLDNISRQANVTYRKKICIDVSRLLTMCKYMGIGTIGLGTDSYLRYMLRKKLQKIKEDDKLIQAEGIESLSEDELRQACRDRGLLGLLSMDEMRKQLQDWLDLSLNHSLPSSLLILSRAFSVSGKVKPEDAVQATLSSLPDEVVDTVGVTALLSGDSVSEKRRKLEFLEMQEELIKEEEEEDTKTKESSAGPKDVALEETAIAAAEEEGGEDKRARARLTDKQKQLCEISSALAVLASASSVSREREEFLRLVNKEV